MNTYYVILWCNIFKKQFCYQIIFILLNTYSGSLYRYRNLKWLKTMVFFPSIIYYIYYKSVKVINIENGTISCSLFTYIGTVNIIYYSEVQELDGLQCYTLK